MKEWQQKLIPQRMLSTALGKFANATLGPLTQFAIKRFVKAYNVNLSEALIDDVKQFESFNAFFTRELKPSARTIVQDDHSFVSPVDGTVSAFGHIEEGQLLQAKGATYSLLALCGGDVAVAKHFDNGSFLTAYLSPRDYHRFHMPIAGTLLEMIYVPGDLFAVNQSSVENVNGLFARNERVICIFETAFGKMAVIAVGAMIVGSIAMQWHGVVAPKRGRSICHWRYEDDTIALAQGEEMGYFQLGSTIIVLMEKDTITWNAELNTKDALVLGEWLGRVG
jgi:phosphatidylserine decarboxylase